MTECRECGGTVSTSARACPHCGAKPAYRPSVAFVVIAGLLLAFGIKSTFFSGSDAPPIAKPVQDEAAERRYLVVAIAAKKLRDSLGDPESVEWIDMLADERAELVCLKYRARNAFGGMQVYTATLTAQLASDSTDDWNRLCAGASLYNVSHAAFAY